MPALPAVPQVLEVIFKMGLNDDLDVINRIHCRYTGSAPTNTNLDNLANDLSGQWGLLIAPNVHNNLTLTGITITDLTSPTSAVGIWTGTVGGTGTSGAILGAGSAVRINRKIARRYRGGRPGVFLPLTSSAYLVGPQTLTGAYIAAIQTAWTDLESEMTSLAVTYWATSAQSVSVSYYEGSEPFTTPSGRVRNIPKLRVGGPVVDTLVEIAVLDRVASQRRRNLTRT